jgi:hypothetical protein
MNKDSYTYCFHVSREDGSCSTRDYPAGTSNIYEEEKIEANEEGSIPPMTLAINNQLMVTNGYTSDLLVVWNHRQGLSEKLILSGTCLYSISESIALKRFGLFISPFREVNFAEMSSSRPGFIFSSVSHRSPGGRVEKYGLVCWDFDCREGSPVKKKSFVRGVLDLVSEEDDEDVTIRTEERAIWLVLE